MVCNLILVSGTLSILVNIYLHSVAFHSMYLASAVDKDEIFKVGARLFGVWRTVVGLKASLQPKGAIRVGTVWGDIESVTVAVWGPCQALAALLTSISRQRRQSWLGATLLNLRYPGPRACI
jgi:hypothetical protein